MKFFHNANIGKVLVLVFAVGIHGAFGFGAYYMGLYISSLILGESDWGAQVAAIVYGVAVFLGAIWAFMYGEYAREDIRVYRRARGGYAHWALNALLVFIALNEVGSLGFRLAHVNDTVVRFWIGLVGLVILGIAYLLGLVIHVMANRPIEAQFARMVQTARYSAVDDIARYIPQLTTDQKIRLGSGDTRVLDEVRDMTQSEQDEARRREQQSEAEQQSILDMSNGFFSPKPDAPTGQASSRSQHNGVH